ncbi:hypothetical protein BBO99_00003676 [Phytophthora kernoviae]|uniref:Uncharacterized protein n=2 Tax=Phytophthora kernoviae TaxID=325452 RepID=A0A421EYM3_9STRA|nr:hypothetical protein G195_006090 [Phytophthora kernoviae 00238/432]KAG2523498.1 hypothetical protein JM16_002265 [Phytophthora kernoviae]KAG2525413.1 hypothetical protein JM18_002347 [Phytophthora kernoviae]RLN10485.1 hypothetical protein BBI17_003706 [Phytophthora kernoviae]RLN81470.1 hypothetical protein BBO99_00003676 [Phytophthora kernoviae]
MSSKLNLYTSVKQREAENQHRMQVYDDYLQSLLRLPAFSMFGSDASTMLDTFLDISRHLTSFRKLEKELGQSMHLRDRKVVPWKDRDRFEVVYKMHLQVIAAQEERARRAEMANEAHHRRELRAERPRKHSHKHRYEGVEKINTASVNPLPAPVNIDVSAEEPRPGESLREHIARIGHRLVTEAFEE